MNEVTITPTDNGPYFIRGKVALLDADGNPYEADDTIALCRCGRSSAKPFCDGTHEKAHFAAVNRSPTDSAAATTTSTVAGATPCQPSASEPSVPAGSRV